MTAPDSDSQDPWRESDPARFWDLHLPASPDLSSLTPPKSKKSTKLPHSSSSHVPAEADALPNLDFSLHLHPSATPLPPIDFSVSVPTAPPPRRKTRFPWAGELIIGFRIIRELGRGAFARVYLAEQLALASRMVALKVSIQPVGDESQLLARLQHAHIVPIHSVHEDPETGYHLICMPYLGGANLAQVLEAAGVESREVSHATGGSLVEALDQVGGPPPSRTLSHDGPFGSNLPGETFEVPIVSARTLGRAATTGMGSSRVRSVLGRYWARLADWGLVHEDEGAEPAESENAQPARRFLRNASYIQASAWIAARLAEGLEHAHSRRLLHRDLKPSNVLITAEGMPMILDFNLSAVVEPGVAGSRARIGGTLPYMAPEQIDAFHPNGTTTSDAVDERSDLYSLGLILFEMVTGRHPFRDPPDGPPMVQVLDEMLAERRAGPPSARKINSEVPWSLEAIIRKCLDPEPSRRYHSATELAEDLRRFLEDRPLRFAPEPSLREQVRKFLRRNPQLTSSTSVALVSLALMSGIAGLLWMVRSRWEVDAARLALNDFEEDFTQCQLLLNTSSELDGPSEGQRSRGLKQTARALRRYHVDTLGDQWDEAPMARALPPSDRRDLAELIAELLMLEARAAVFEARDGSEGGYAQALHRAVDRLNLAEKIDPRPPSTLFSERANYEAALGEADEARRDRLKADQTPPETARDYYLRGTAALASGRPDLAESQLGIAISLDPKRFWSWFAQGLCHFDQRRYADAANDFASCILLDEDSAWAHANRGLALAYDGRLPEARISYDQAVALDPDLVTVRINRALASLELDAPKQAADDLEYAITRAGRRDPVLLAAWGEALARSGRRDEAEIRFNDALKDRPGDPTILIARGFMRLEHDPVTARSDLETALRRSPRSARAHLGLAHLLRDDTPEAALEHLDLALKSEPGLLDAIQLRALVRGRLGMRSAIADVDTLLLSPTPHRLYNAAATLALLSKKTNERGLLVDALDLFKRAVDAGFEPEFAATDPDMEPLLEFPEFRSLVGLK